MNIFVAVQGLTLAQKNSLARMSANGRVAFADDLKNAAEQQGAASQAEIIFGNVPVEWIERNAVVRWVQLDSAGVDAYLGLNRDRSSPILLTNLSGFYDRAVAEAVLAGILAFDRQLPRLLAAQRERRWIKSEVEPAIRQLHGSRVVILGAGGIAQRLAMLLQAFECQLGLFARRSPSAQWHTLAELDSALPERDVLINTLPHTPQTINILNAERIARLPATAIIVNAGRGSALDEDALVAALDARRLAGAILDVTQPEPLPVDSPLWSHPQVILTQHTGGRFPGETQAKVDFFEANLLRFIKAEPLNGAVDPERGY